MEKKQSILSNIKKRTQSSDITDSISGPEQRYHILKQTIIIRTEAEIKSQIEIAKALYEIKENQLYLYDNYKNFSQFLKDYNKGRTQAYRYISIIAGIENGEIQEREVLEHGFKFAERKLVSSSKEKKEQLVRNQFLLSFSLKQFKDKEKQQWVLKNKKNIENYLLKQINHHFDDFSTLLKEYMKS